MEMTDEKRGALPLITRTNREVAIACGNSEWSDWCDIVDANGSTCGSMYMFSEEENERRAKRIVALINQYGWEGDL